MTQRYSVSSLRLMPTGRGMSLRDQRKNDKDATGEVTVTINPFATTIHSTMMCCFLDSLRELSQNLATSAFPSWS